MEQSYYYRRMSQIEEIIKEHLGKIIGGSLTAVGGIWYWLTRNKKKEKADTTISEAEAEITKIKARSLKDRYYEEQEKKWIKKIESLSERLEAAEKHQDELQRQLDMAKQEVRDLKSEINLYKTIRSTQQ